MGDFSKKSFTAKSIVSEDQGVSVKSVVQLIENSKFYEDLYKLLNVEEIIDDFINIPGAKTLVAVIKAEDKKYRKYDLESTFDRLHFLKDDKGEFNFKFTEVDQEDILDTIEGDSFTCEPIYSAKSDFFESTFGMEKYANSLTRGGHSDLIYRNLELIREIYSKGKSHKKVYRLLQDIKGKFYLRAIVSNQYNDYNNNITVFLGLIALHQEMKNTDAKFVVNRCEYNESFVRIYFEKTNERIVEKVGIVKYIIELSNDEIKREALRFSGVTSIVYGGDNPESNEVYIKPDNLRSKILSITHKRTPEKAILELTSLSEYVKIENEMYDDVEKISLITKPEQIRFLVESKIDKTKQNELRKYIIPLKRELQQRVDTIHQLLKLLNKLDLVVEDIDAKEYLRYIMYQVLIEARNVQKEQ